jgi:hypothetical protein
MSPYLPSMHCTDGDAACTNQDFISLIASAYLPISYTSHEPRGRPDGRCPVCQTLPSSPARNNTTAIIAATAQNNAQYRTTQGQVPHYSRSHGR